MLTTARGIEAKEDEINDAFMEWLAKAAPVSYDPVMGYGPLYGYMRAIEAIWGSDVHESVAYWVYDVPTKHGRTVECTCNGKKYNAKNLNSYVAFCMAENQ